MHAFFVFYTTVCFRVAKLDPMALGLRDAQGELKVWDLLLARPVSSNRFVNL